MRIDAYECMFVCYTEIYYKLSVRRRQDIRARGLHGGRLGTVLVGEDLLVAWILFIKLTVYEDGFLLLGCHRDDEVYPPSFLRLENDSWCLAALVS